VFSSDCYKLRVGDGADSTGYSFTFCLETAFLIKDDMSTFAPTDLVADTGSEVSMID